MSILDDELDVLENTDVGNPKFEEIKHDFDKSHNIWEYWIWDNQLYFKYNMPDIVGYKFKVYSTYSNKHNSYYIKLKMINNDNNIEEPCVWFLDNDSTKRSAVKKKVFRLFNFLAYNPYIVHIMLGDYSKYMYDWFNLSWLNNNDGVALNLKVIKYLKNHHPNKRMNIKDLQDFSDFINNEK